MQFPQWLSGILGILPLVHTWIPLPAALSSLVWIGLIGLMMVVAPGRTPQSREHVDDAAPGIHN